MSASFGNREDVQRLMRVDKDIYTPEEIAELFDNVTVEEVREAVFRGHLPAIRDDERIVGIHRADFLNWMERGPK